MFTRLGKKCGLAILAACLAFPVTGGLASAEIGNDITVNPFGFIGWGPDIEYEGVMGTGMALLVRAKFGGFSIGDWSVTTIGGGLGLNFYPQPENPAPRGLFLGPVVDVFNVSAGFKGETPGSAIFYHAYLQLGYKWLMGEKVAFVLAPFLKLGYAGGTLNSATGTDTLSGGGVLYGLGLDVGVAF